MMDHDFDAIWISSPKEESNSAAVARRVVNWDIGPIDFRPFQKKFIQVLTNLFHQPPWKIQMFSIPLEN